MSQFPRIISGEGGGGEEEEGVSGYVRNRGN